MNPIINRVQKELLDNYPDLEKIRIRSENYSIFYITANIIGVLVFLIILLVGNFMGPFLSILGIIAYIILLHFNTLPRLEYKKYFDSIKSKSIETILKQIDTSFEYVDGAIPTEDIMLSELFYKRKKALEGQNYFKGIYKGMNVQISEIEPASMRTSILFIAKINNNIDSKIFIYDRGFDNDESNPLPVAYQTGKRVSIENVDFEKTFHTTSTDESMAREVLSQKFIERILTVKEYLNGSKIFVSFCNKRFSILIYNRLLFEPVLHESIKDNKTFLRFYREVLYILRITDILSLNKM